MDAASGVSEGGGLGVLVGKEGHPWAFRTVGGIDASRMGSAIGVPVVGFAVGSTDGAPVVSFAVGSSVGDIVVGRGVATTAAGVPAMAASIADILSTAGVAGAGVGVVVAPGPPLAVGNAVSFTEDIATGEKVAVEGSKMVVGEPVVIVAIEEVFVAAVMLLLPTPASSGVGMLGAGGNAGAFDAVGLDVETLGDGVASVALTVGTVVVVRASNCEVLICAFGLPTTIVSP